MICNPPDDNNKRFLLGKNGSNEMLATGLNPSTANKDNLDPTSRNIQAIAQNNGCNGWWLVNLNAQRTPKPSNLPKKVNQVIAKENPLKLSIALMKETIDKQRYLNTG